MKQFTFIWRHGDTQNVTADSQLQAEGYLNTQGIDCTDAQVYWRHLESWEF